jgi:uncharacterized protein YcfJ
MKRTAIAVAAGLALGPSAAFAGGGIYEDYARVREVTPEYESVNLPRKDCYSEYVPGHNGGGRGNSLVGALVGGVAGGLIGSRVGEGNGKIAASAGAAAIGAIVGDRLARRGGEQYYEEREVRRCRTVDNWESRISGYRVAYEYGGRTYTTVLPYDPGSRLPVRVNVEPADIRGDHWDR